MCNNQIFRFSVVSILKKHTHTISSDIFHTNFFPSTSIDRIQYLLFTIAKKREYNTVKKKAKKKLYIERITSHKKIRYRITDKSQYHDPVSVCACACVSLVFTLFFDHHYHSN